jgi:thiamine-phosphate pyrophosphorylase
MGKEAPSVLERFKASRLYVITTPPVNTTYEQMVKNACIGGADVVQFRDKTMSHKDRYDLATHLRVICAAYNVLFIVNDHIEVALASGADGVHLGQDDLPISAALALAHQMGVTNFLIGRSTHSVEQAVQAEGEGADYIAVGPVFATPTKPTYQAVGLNLVSMVSKQVLLPQVAIGGINAENVHEVLSAGAKRVAVVRAVCGEPDIRAAAQRMKTLLEERKVVKA